MNKKIEELMLVACEDETLEGLPLMEKFAELIIQECITACENNSWMMLDAYRRSAQIKKHFGVE